MKVVEQTTFEAVSFDASRANLHTKPSTRSASVVVFVHGLLGSGYGTWGTVPASVFTPRDAEPIDVCVFQYRTWFRKTPRDRPSLAAVLDQLAAALVDLADEYVSVYLVGHSLGGKLAERVAMRFLTHIPPGHGSPVVTPLGGLLLVAAPRAGSRWAVGALRPVMKEQSALRVMSDRDDEIAEYLSSMTSGVITSPVDPQRFLLPVFVATAGSDFLVNSFSAGFGVPATQRKPLAGTHRSIVKPKPGDAQLVDWIRASITKAEDLRAQWRRELDYRASHRAGPRQQSDFLVTECRTGPAGLRWELAYQEVRRSLSSPDFPIYDAEEVPDGPVDLLFSIPEAPGVLGANQDDRELVDAAYLRASQPERVGVTISPTGTASTAAAGIVREWLPPGPLPPSLFIEPAENRSALQALIGARLQGILSRDPRRSAATVVRGMDIVWPDGGM